MGEQRIGDGLAEFHGALVAHGRFAIQTGPVEGREADANHGNIGVDGDVAAFRMPHDQVDLDFAAA